MNSVFAFRRRAPGAGRFVFVVAFIVLGVAPRLMGPAAAQAPAASAAAKTAGLVNGEPITEDQVVAAAAADLQSLEARQPRNERTLAYDRLAIMHKALDAVAEQKLLALEAAKLQTTPQQIVEAEITSNVAVPSDEDVVATYERNKPNIGMSSGLTMTPNDEAQPAP